MRKYSWLLLVVTSMMMLIQCSKNNSTNTVVSGNQPAISGVLYNTDGSFSKNAIVSIRKKNVLADTSVFSLAKRTGDSLTQVTDEIGRFSFNADLEPDLYVIEAINGKNGLLIDSVKIAKKAQSVNLEADTLRPMGALKGNISLSNGGDPQQFYVLAFGINRFAKVNAGGRFFFADLSQGMYTIRLLSGLKDYSTLDAGNISVNEGETATVATLSPTYRRALIPSNVIASYDTMQQVVTLRWNTLDSALVKGYNIYRRNISTNSAVSTLLDSNAVGDTIFVDLMGIQDQTYEYRITAKDKNNQESVKSDGIRVTIASYFSIDTVFSPVQLDMGFTVSSSGDIYAPLARDKLIQVYDSTMQPKRQFGTGIWQYQSVRVSNNSVYALQLDQGVQNVLDFDASGTLIDTLVTDKHISAIDANKGLVAVAFYPDSIGAGDSISLFSGDGILKKTWDYDHEFKCNGVCIGDSNRIFAALSSQTSSLPKVAAYDPLGNKISETIIQSQGWIDGIAYDAKKQWLYVASDDQKTYLEGAQPVFDQNGIGIIYVFDRNNSIIAYFRVINGSAVTSIALQDNGSLFIDVAGNAGPLPVKTRIIKLKPLQR